MLEPHCAQQPSIMLVCIVGLADDHSGVSEVSAGWLAITFSLVPFHKSISCQCLLVAKVGFLEVECWLSGDRPNACFLVFPGSEVFLFVCVCVCQVHCTQLWKTTQF